MGPENVGQQFIPLFHGSTQKFRVGDVILPKTTVGGVPYAWAYADPMHSHNFIEGQNMNNKEMTTVYTYPVENVEGDLELDPRQHEPHVVKFENKNQLTRKAVYHEIVSRKGYRVAGKPVLTTVVGQGRGGIWT